MKKLYSLVFLFTVSFAQEEDPMFQSLVTKPDPEYSSNTFALRSVPEQEQAQIEQQQQRPWYQQTLRTNIENTRAAIDKYKPQIEQMREQGRQTSMMLRDALKQKGKMAIDQLLDKTPEELAQLGNEVRLQATDIIKRAAELKPQAPQVPMPITIPQQTMNLYTIAQAATTSSPEQIKQALIGVSDMLETKKFPEKEMMRLELKKDALQFLLNPENRALYDVQNMQK